MKLWIVLFIFFFYQSWPFYVITLHLSVIQYDVSKVHNTSNRQHCKKKDNQAIIIEWNKKPHN